MSFISTRDHHLFIQQFQSFLENYPNKKGADENLQLINADIDKLQQIVTTYKDAVSQLQVLAIEYKTIIKRARINMRRQQIKKMETSK